VPPSREDRPRSRGDSPMSRDLRLECRSSAINRKTAHQTGEPAVVRALGTPRMLLPTADWRGCAIRCRSCEDGCGLLLGHTCSTPPGAMPGSALRKEPRIERCEFSHHRAFPPATRPASATAAREARLRSLRRLMAARWCPALQSAAVAVAVIDQRKPRTVTRSA
jgi:hypothetical protein